MWHFQQWKNIYRHVIILNCIGLQATSDTSKNIPFNNRRFVNSVMKQKRSKTWDVKWQGLRDKEVLDQLRVYWDRGTKNNADYLTECKDSLWNKSSV